MSIKSNDFKDTGASSCCENETSSKRSHEYEGNAKELTEQEEITEERVIDHKQRSLEGFIQRNQIPETVFEYEDTQEDMYENVFTDPQVNQSQLSPKHKLGLSAEHNASSHVPSPISLSPSDNLQDLSNSGTVSPTSHGICDTSRHHRVSLIPKATCKPRLSPVPGLIMQSRLSLVGDPHTLPRRGPTAADLTTLQRRNSRVAEPNLQLITSQFFADQVQTVLSQVSPVCDPSLPSRVSPAAATLAPLTGAPTSGDLGNGGAVAQPGPYISDVLSEDGDVFGASSAEQNCVTDLRQQNCVKDPRRQNCVTDLSRQNYVTAVPTSSSSSSSPPLFVNQMSETLSSATLHSRNSSTSSFSDGGQSAESCSTLQTSSPTFAAGVSTFTSATTSTNATQSKVKDEPGSGLAATKITSDGAQGARPGKKSGKPMSYIELISKAILSSTDQRLMLQDIYKHIMGQHPYYNNDNKAWRNSVRQNLSLNECFEKYNRTENGKGHFWRVHPNCVDDFVKGDFRRRRARQQTKIKPHNLLFHSNLSPPSSSSSSCGLSPGFGLAPGAAAELGGHGFFKRSGNGCNDSHPQTAYLDWNAMQRGEEDSGNNSLGVGGGVGGNSWFPFRNDMVPESSPPAVLYPGGGQYAPLDASLNTQPVARFSHPHSSSALAIKRRGAAANRLVAAEYSLHPSSSATAASYAHNGYVSIAPPPPPPGPPASVYPHPLHHPRELDHYATEGHSNPQDALYVPPNSHLHHHPHNRSWVQNSFGDPRDLPVSSVVSGGQADPHYHHQHQANYAWSLPPRSAELVRSRAFFSSHGSSYSGSGAYHLGISDTYPALSSSYPPSGSVSMGDFSSTLSHSPGGPTSSFLTSPEGLSPSGTFSYPPAAGQIPALESVCATKYLPYPAPSGQTLTSEGVYADRFSPYRPAAGQSLTFDGVGDCSSRKVPPKPQGGLSVRYPYNAAQRGRGRGSSGGNDTRLSSSSSSSSTSTPTALNSTSLDSASSYCFSPSPSASSGVQPDGQMGYGPNSDSAQITPSFALSGNSYAALAPSSALSGNSYAALAPSSALSGNSYAALAPSSALSGNTYAALAPSSAMSGNSYAALAPSAALSGNSYAALAPSSTLSGNSYATLAPSPALSGNIYAGLQPSPNGLPDISGVVVDNPSQYFPNGMSTNSLISQYYIHP